MSRRGVVQRVLVPLVGVTQIAGGALLGTYLVRSIALGVIPLWSYVSLGLYLALLAVLAGALLLKNAVIGYALSRVVQSIQLISISLPKLGLVVILGPQLRVSWTADASIVVNAGFFSFYAMFFGNNGGLPWGINIVPLIALLVLSRRSTPMVGHTTETIPSAPQ